MNHSQLFVQSWIVIIGLGLAGCSAELGDDLRQANRQPVSPPTASVTLDSFESAAASARLARLPPPWARSGLHESRPRNRKIAPAARERLDWLAVSPEPVLLTVRFDTPPSSAQLEAWERQSGHAVEFEIIDGHYALVGPIIGARVGHGGAEFLTALDPVTRLAPAWPMVVDPEPPLYDPLGINRAIGATAAAHRVDSQGQRLTGKGVIIAAIDSGVDIFHPLLFRADAGYYDWIDVDRDGMFQPDIDAVDLDGNGAADPGEVLRALGGAIYERSTGKWSHPDGFEPGRQWLYADSDQSGSRERGPGRFDEATPAYGEPLFLVDDIDKSGTLDAGEKLRRLGTSKIRSVVRIHSGQTYARGVDLMDTPLHSNIPHGTSTASILLGGTPGLTMVEGIAPDAELIMVDRYPMSGDPASPVLTLAGAASLVRDMGARIVLHEYGNLVGYFGDGADDFDAALDALSAQGIVSTASNHNFAGQKGFARFAIPGNATKEIEIQVSAPASGSQSIQLSARWLEAAADDLSVTLTPPGSAPIEAVDGSWVADGETWLHLGRDSSPRGTHKADIRFIAWNGASYVPMPSGVWTLTLHNSSSEPIDIHLSMSHSQTGYATYVDFVADTTDVGTMAWPATADSTISVGAMVFNRVQGDETRGGLKYYSGRGPRIDGARGIDLVAPPDPYTASASVTHAGHYRQYGGTSGAQSHVAGTIALLLQEEPELTPEQIRTTLQQSAIADSNTGVTPNTNWGYGKLDTHRALFDEHAPDIAEPSARLDAPGRTTHGVAVSLDASASLSNLDAEPDLTYRWDFDYDGVWDRESTEARIGYQPATLGPRVVKLEVENALGFIDQAQVRVDIGTCGDSRADVGEECDDGNDDNSDACLVGCSLPVCGDRIVSAGEACDDGNTDDNDGCTSACAVPRCGDGIVSAGEACDDGNTDDNDACSSACQHLDTTEPGGCSSTTPSSAIWLLCLLALGLCRRRRETPMGCRYPRPR